MTDKEKRNNWLEERLNLWNVFMLLHGQGDSEHIFTKLYNPKNKPKFNSPNTAVRLNLYFMMNKIGIKLDGPGTPADIRSTLMSNHKKPRQKTDGSGEAYCNALNSGQVLSHKVLLDNTEAILREWDYRNNFCSLLLGFFRGKLKDDLCVYKYRDEEKFNKGFKLDKNTSDLIDTLIYHLEQMNKIQLTERNIQEEAEILTWVLLLALLGNNVTELHACTDFCNSPYPIPVPDPEPHKEKEIEATKENAEEVPPTLRIYDHSTLNFQKRFTDCMFLDDLQHQISLQDVYQVPRFVMNGDLDEKESLELNAKVLNQPEDKRTAAVSKICGKIENDFHKFFNTVIEKSLYIDGQRTTPQRVLTVLGKPGSGKSSLIEYLVNNPAVKGKLLAQGFHSIHIIRFADLANYNLNWNQEAKNLISDILMACSTFPEEQAYTFKTDYNRVRETELNGVLLILDGFDEITLPSHIHRHEIIKNLQKYFNQTLCKTFQNNLNEKRRDDQTTDSNQTQYDTKQNFLLLITCRNNYIDTGKQQNDNLQNYIHLSPLNQAQVLHFAAGYNMKISRYGLTPYPMEVLLNPDTYTNSQFQEILGIPIILYMIIAYRIVLKEYSSASGNMNTMTDIYDRIFRLEDGIFSHFDKNDNVSSDRSVNRIDVPMACRQEHLLISKLIATEMFLVAPEGELPNAIYTKIKSAAEKRLEAKKVNANFDEIFKGNGYLIFRDKHIEAGSSVAFVHRSMYEYFTGCYLFDQIKAFVEGAALDASKNLSDQEKIKAHNAREALKTLRLILQSRQLTPEIEQHLNRKLQQFYNHRMVENPSNLFGVFKKTFNEMLEANRFLCSELPDEYHLEQGHAYDAQHMGANTFLNLRHELLSFLNHLSVLRTMLFFQSEGPAAVQPYTKDTRSAFDRYIRQTIQDRLELQWCAKKFDDADQGIENILQSVRDAVYEKLNFSYLDLSGIKLQHMNLSDICFDHSSLKDTQMSHTVLTRSSFLKAVFTHADLTYANLRQGIFCSNGQEAIFDGVNLSNADMQSVDLHGISFTNSHLEDTHMYDTNISGCKFHYAVLSGADMVSCKAVGTNFTGAVMMHVDLEDADLSGADFTDTQLIASKFSGAVITKDTQLDTYGKEAVRKGDGVLA